MLHAWRLIGADAVRVVDTREAWIAVAPRALGDARVIAALDIGWLGAATDKTIVDLAGLTDAGIAALPGGHTSKRVAAPQLASRGVDALVFLRRRGCEGACVLPDGGPYDRAVEERLSGETWITEGFAPTAEITGGGLTYVVWKKR
jgi:hypothetical protein